jgi:hypothetical protein
MPRCSHNKFDKVDAEVHNDAPTYNKGSWVNPFKYKSFHTKCSDCDKEVLIEIKYGKLTGFDYTSGKLVGKCECHKYDFIVDLSTVEKKQRRTFGGTMLRLFMGGGMDGIQYESYYAAVAKCARCKQDLPIKSSIHEKWQNKKLIQSYEWTRSKK